MLRIISYSVFLMLIFPLPSTPFPMSNVLDIFKDLDCPKGIAESTLDKIKEGAEKAQPYYRGIIDSFKSIAGCANPFCLIKANIQVATNVVVLVHTVTLALANIAKIYATCLVATSFKLVTGNLG